MAIRQIIEERGAWVIKVPCDFCSAEQGYDATRAWRLCVDCHNGLVQQQAEHFKEAQQPAG
jgi:hypothetical protein